MDDIKIKLGLNEIQIVNINLRPADPNPGIRLFNVCYCHFGLLSASDKPMDVDNDSVVFVLRHN